MNLEEIRERYPYYKNVSDEKLANAMYEKHYSHADREEFNKRIGYNPEQNNEEGFIQKHLINPIKGAQGRTSLETAGNLADLLINKPIEMTGLPSFARGAFQGGENIIRGAGNIPADIYESTTGKQNYPISAPGIGQIYPIPKTEFPKPENVNPIIGETAEAAGSLLGLGSANKLYQGAQKGLESLPYIKNAPEYIKKILAASSTGSIISPDNRKLGAGLGAIGSTLSSAAPSAINAINKLKPNAFEAIQSGYDSKLRKLTNMFADVGKDVATSGIKEIKLPKTFFSELEEIGPQSKTFKRFLNEAKSGSYGNLRKLNTELFKRGTKYAASPFPSDVEKAEDMFNLRDNLNEVIEKALRHTGLHESADTLNKAMLGFKNLKNTYSTHPTIAKLVGENRIVPSKSTVFRENSERMKRLKAEHPEIEKQLGYEKKLKAAMTLASGSGILGGIKYFLNG